MEIFMREVHPNATKLDLQKQIARHLHSPPYSSTQVTPLNFEVYLFPSKTRFSSQSHAGYGTLTLPRRDIGEMLLRDFGSNWPIKYITVLGKRVKVSLSKKQPPGHVVEKLQRLPYISPEAIQDKEARMETLRSSHVGIHIVQFGWETRDGKFSAEWEKSFLQGCSLTFGEEKRELRINISDASLTTRSIVVQLSRIIWSAVGDDGEPAIFLSLANPPAFEVDSITSILVSAFGQGARRDPKRDRLCSLYDDDEHLLRILSYASISIRLVCKSYGDLDTFKDLCRTARLRAPKAYSYAVERRAIFSEDNLNRFQAWLTELDFQVAFQVQALSQCLLADVVELYSLRSSLGQIIHSHGPAYAASLLRYFITDIKVSLMDSASGLSQETFLEYFLRCRDTFSTTLDLTSRKASEGVFDCFHAIASPTTVKLEGPLPERSNRIIRMYADNQDSFLRVSFVDEDSLQYRADRDIDGPRFIHRFIRRILRDGLRVAGRHFHFLAYSQSALKSHTVWFVKNFFDASTGQTIGAPEIIRRLGNFHNLAFDPTLIYCPARYGARISQAFTATDASVRVEAEKVFTLQDVMDESSKWCFTDGVGTISLELAKDIWRVLRQAGKRSTRGAVGIPRAFQIRLMGSKGMLSVDHRLSGRIINLRPSMIKFDAPDSTEVEIAQAFVRPSLYYLNRPLIMILEGLGVRYEVFECLQRDAVQGVKRSAESYANAARILEQYGLGASFRLPSVLLGLSKLGLQPSSGDDFYQRMLNFAIHHILRDLKHHARIPVPNGYTLVGVADIHGYLREGQIFACVKDPQTHCRTYLKGKTLISRSPTIHPGDVQCVEAIGEPPAGSPFASESLANTVVFSIGGDRPLPSYLGGGDLDGDTYNLTSMPELLPPTTNQPAAYDAAPKKLLLRHSTMEDVADFVTDYVNNDVLGIVANSWLVIADQSEYGIFDPDCLKLGQIHSDAVDYPKSGTPVSLDTIPKYKFKAKPDWNAPETVDIDRTADFYQSGRAIGRLFRDIDLPELDSQVRSNQRKRSNPPSQDESHFEDVFAAMCLEDHSQDDVYTAVEERVSEFIPIGEPFSEHVRSALDMLTSYATELQSTCAANAIQRWKSSMLTEEEAVVGTIVAKCSQKRRRKDAMANLRDQTSYLVKKIRDKIAGDEESFDDEEWLTRAWTAWQVSRLQDEHFGAKSFGWVALGEVFDAIRSIEQENRTARSRGL
ncbi:RdRP-domain-containing protein [Dentipellis sp. KUC8613]|nr:RdRP-domain-containing protein [Dentipellis sp. KUC8613]